MIGSLEMSPPVTLECAPPASRLPCLNGARWPTGGSKKLYKNAGYAYHLYRILQMRMKPAFIIIGIAAESSALPAQD